MLGFRASRPALGPGAGVAAGAQASRRVGGASGLEGRLEDVKKVLTRRARQSTTEHEGAGPEDVWFAVRRSGRPPACGHADPAPQQDRRNDGDLHRGALGGHP
jgi:hypothetical protein